MVEISINGGNLHLEMKGLDRILAFRNQLDIPISHVVDASHDPKTLCGWYHGIKSPGAIDIPRIVTAGTFNVLGTRMFWDVHNVQNAIIIRLQHDQFDELVVEVSDPEAAVGQIKARLKSG
jgi:hypothetical protein